MLGPFFWSWASRAITLDLLGSNYASTETTKGTHGDSRFPGPYISDRSIELPKIIKLRLASRLNGDMQGRMTRQELEEKIDELVREYWLVLIVILLTVVF